MSCLITQNSLYETSYNTGYARKQLEELYRMAQKSLDNFIFLYAYASETKDSDNEGVVKEDAMNLVNSK